MKIAPHADLQTIKRVPIRNFVVLNLYPQEIEEEEPLEEPIHDPSESKIDKLLQLQNML